MKVRLTPLILTAHGSATHMPANPFLVPEPAGMTRSTLKRTVFDSGLTHQTTSCQALAIAKRDMSIHLRTWQDIQSLMRDMAELHSIECSSVLAASSSWYHSVTDIRSIYAQQTVNTSERQKDTGLPQHNKQTFVGAFEVGGCESPALAEDNCVALVRSEAGRDVNCDVGVPLLIPASSAHAIVSFSGDARPW